jgi:hypothetical protein
VRGGEPVAVEMVGMKRRGDRGIDPPGEGVVVCHARVDGEAAKAIAAGRPGGRSRHRYTAIMTEAGVDLAR